MQDAMRVMPKVLSLTWQPSARIRRGAQAHAPFSSYKSQPRRSGRGARPTHALEGKHAPGAPCSSGATEQPPAGSLLPAHIAVIMDGNQRWASKQNQPVAAGHQSGVKALRETVAACLDRGIAALTVYALSEENWGREAHEVEFLLNLVDGVLRAELESLKSSGVRLAFIGNLTRLPHGLQRQLERAEQQTAGNGNLHLTIALSYSSRHDITRAAQDLVQAAIDGQLTADQVTQELVASHLSTGRLLPAHPQQAVDLVIRTSGEKRLSNFLLWESAYAELHFADVCWPEFCPEHLDAALQDYAMRDRRYGSRRKGCG